jgi:hypothetical protein
VLGQSGGRKSPLRAKFPPCISGVDVLTGISSILICAQKFGRRTGSLEPNLRVHREVGLEL